LFYENIIFNPGSSEFKALILLILFNNITKSLKEPIAIFIFKLIYLFNLYYLIILFIFIILLLKFKIFKNNLLFIINLINLFLFNYFQLILLLIIIHFLL